MFKRLPLLCAASVATIFGAVGACGSESGGGPGPSPDGGADAPAHEADAAGDSSEAGKPPRCDASRPFGPLTAVSEITGDVHDAWLTSDEKTILYSFLERGDGLKIYTATRATEDGTFGPGARLPNVNTSDQNYGAAMSEDRLRLVYMSSGYRPSISIRKSVDDPFLPSGGLSLNAYNSRTDNALSPRYSARGIYYVIWRERDVKHRLYFDASKSTTATLIRESNESFSYAITPDERTIYVTEQEPRTDAGSRRTIIKRATRTSPDGTFGDYTPLPEFEADSRRIWVDWVSEDECVLYGSTISPSAIYRAVRGK